MFPFEDGIILQINIYKCPMNFICSSTKVSNQRYSQLLVGDCGAQGTVFFFFIIILFYDAAIEEYYHKFPCGFHVIVIYKFCRMSKVVGVSIVL